MTEIPWTWLGIRASGLTAWGLLTAVVVWGLLLRTQLLGRLASPKRLMEMHRWLGAISLAFLLLHLALLLVDPTVRFTVTALLVPGASPWEPFAVGLGTVALWALLPVTIVGRIRSRLGSAGNRWFRRSHLLAYAAWPLATAHYALAGTDALTAASVAALIAATTAVAGCLLVRAFVPRPTPVRSSAPASALVTRP